METYPLEWITIHEVIQNAKDAIQKSSKSSGTINVTLDLTNEMVILEDDEKGFPHKISLFGLGGTDKDIDPEHEKLVD